MNKTKNTSAPAHYRQGDLLIERVALIPKEAKKVPSKNGRTLLALGVATGHSHWFAAEEVTKLAVKDGAEYFLAKGTSLKFRLPIVEKTRKQVTVNHPKLGRIAFAIAEVAVDGDQVTVDGPFALWHHDEHDTQAVLAGSYRGGGDGGKPNQREYAPEGIRRVTD
jgi:hypothetical protein